MKTLFGKQKYLVSILMTCLIILMTHITSFDAVPAAGGICQVGDVIAPGESCTYPDTNTKFSVNANGTGQFLFLNVGSNLNLEDATINGVSYTLVAKKLASGSWEIEKIGTASGTTNTAPVFTDGVSTTRSVAENTAASTNIGTPIAATDADSGDTLTYTLGGTDAASFNIVSTSGQLQTKAALDYETKSSYTVTITVSDGNGGSDSITVTINVTDVIEAIIISPRFVPVVDRTPEVRDAIVAALPNVTDAAKVTKEQVAAITSLNLRNAGITALKAGDFSGMTGLTSINLYNNQLSSLPNGVFEGLTSLTTVRLGRNAIDPLPFVVSLEKVGNGQFKAVAPAGALFNIVLHITLTNGSVTGGVTTVTIPQGSRMSDALTVTRTAGTTAHVTVDIEAFPSLPRNHYGYTFVKSGNLPLVLFRGTNTAPVFTEGSTATRSVRENTDAGQHIGTAVGATDVDGDALAYTIGGTDAAAFSIDATTGQLKTEASLDYETKNSYSVTVSVSDGNGGSDSVFVTINVTDVAESYLIDGLTQQVQDAIVATVPGVDTAADVTAAHLAAITELDLSNKSITSLKSGDFDRLTALTHLNLGSNDLTALPANLFDNLTELRHLYIDHNDLTSIPAGIFDNLTELTHFSLHDNGITLLPAGIFKNLTKLLIFSLRSNKINDISELESLTSLTTLYVGHNPISDYGPLHRLKAAIDAIEDHPGLILDIAILIGGLTQQVQDAIVAAVPGVNNAVDVTAAHLAAITELDLSNKSITSLKSGDFDRLTALTHLNLGSNDLTALPANLFDNLTELRHLYIDHNDLTSIPAGIFDNLTELTHFSLHDNGITLLPAGIFKNLTKLLIFSLRSNKINDISELESLTSLTTLYVGHNPISDYGPLRRLTASIDALEDHPGLTLDITIPEVDPSTNNSPIFTDGVSTKRSIAENTAATVNIGTAITATDADNDTLTYTLGGIDVAAFGIDATTGQLKTKAALDYETKSTYTVTITVSDGNGGTDSITVTINITDVSETPVNTAPVFTEGSTATRSVTENTEARQHIGQAVTATDVDGDTLAYTLGGTDAASFVIDSTTGELKTKASLDYETKTTYTVTVTVSDGTLTDTITVTINVTDIDESLGRPNESSYDHIEGPWLWMIAPGGSIITDNLSKASDGVITEAQIAQNGVNEGDHFNDLQWTNGRLLPTTVCGFFLCSSDNVINVVREIGLTDSYQLNQYSAYALINVHSPHDQNNVLMGVGSDDSIKVWLNGSVVYINDTTRRTTGVQNRFHVNLNAGNNLLLVKVCNSGSWFGNDDWGMFFKIYLDTQDYTISLPMRNTAAQQSPANTAPVFTDGASTTRSIAENTRSGQNIGTAIAASDADNDSLTYTLSGTDAASFRIISTSGQLQTRAALDYETKTSYSVTVSVSDGNGGIDSITVTINVTDVSELLTSTAICKVGDVLKPGQSCTYPDTDAVFSVLANGKSQWNIPNLPTWLQWINQTSVGNSMNVSTTINGVSYHFKAKSVSNNSWEIEEIGDDSSQQPVTPDPGDTGSTPTLSTSTVSTLTEATLHEGVVSLNLSGGTFERSTFTIRNAITASGISGLTFDIFSVDRESDTEVTLELEFDGNMTTNGTFTISLGAGAIKDYDGDALTSQISVSAVTESITASTTAPLTEATLDESVVTLTLSGRKYERWQSTIRPAVSVTGISGVTVRSFDIDRESDTEVTVELTYDGNMTSDGTLTFTVGAGAIAGYNGSALTAQVSVSADTETPVVTEPETPQQPQQPQQPDDTNTGGTLTLSTSTTSTLTEATLHEGVVSLNLSGGTFERSTYTIRNAISVSGISGLTFDTFSTDRESDTEVTFELEFDGNMTTNGTLTISLGAGAIKDYAGAALTSQISVSAVTESITASTTAPLTETTLDESVVTLTLSGRKYERWQSTIRPAVSVTGISGVTVRSFDIDRESDTEVTVELTYDGNMTSDGTLTFTVGAGAIAGYNGSALTAQVSVSADTETPVVTEPETPQQPQQPQQPGNTGGTPTLSLSTASSLTEATLHGAVVSLNLSGGSFESAFWDLDDEISVSGITGVTYNDFFDVDRVSDTKVDIELSFDGNMTSSGTLTFTVESDAIVDYDGTDLTAQISVSAVTESITATTTTALTEGNIDGSEVTITLSGRKFERSSFDIRDAFSVSGITSVTIPWHDPDRESDTELSLELEFDGDMTSDGTLTFTVGADAIAGYSGPSLTAQLSVTAAGAIGLFANYPNPFNPETWFPYQLSKPSDVTITIYDVRGRVVRVLKLGHQAAGVYRNRNKAAHWDGKNETGEPVASGVYFYTLKAGDFTVTRKMLIRK